MTRPLIQPEAVRQLVKIGPIEPRCSAASVSALPTKTPREASILWHMNHQDARLWSLIPPVANR